MAEDTHGHGSLAMPAGLLVAQQDIPGADRDRARRRSPRARRATRRRSRGMNRLSRSPTGARIGRSSRSRSPPPACRREPRPRRWPHQRGVHVAEGDPGRARCRSAARSSAGGSTIRASALASRDEWRARRDLNPRPRGLEATCSGPLSYGRPPPEVEESRRAGPARRLWIAKGQPELIRTRGGSGARPAGSPCRVPAGRGAGSGCRAAPRELEVGSASHAYRPGGGRQHTGHRRPCGPGAAEAFGPKSRCEPIDPGSQGVMHRWPRARLSGRLAVERRGSLWGGRRMATGSDEGRPLGAEDRTRDE